MRAIGQMAFLTLVTAIVCGCATERQDSDLVFHCKFDSLYDIEHPTVGAPGTAKGAEFVEGKVGKALFVPAYISVAEFPFPDGIPSDEGTIEFYAKLGTDRDFFRDGVDPYFFIVEKESANGWPIVFEMNFNANNGCGQSGLFCGMSFGKAVVVPGRSRRWSCRYCDIIGAQDTFGWHLYRICWKRSGLDGAGNIMQLYVDGVLLGSGISSDEDVKTFVTSIASPVRLMFSNPGNGELGKSPVMIDEFKMWSTARPIEFRK